MCSAIGVTHADAPPLALNGDDSTLMASISAEELARRRDLCTRQSAQFVKDICDTYTLINETIDVLELDLENVSKEDIPIPETMDTETYASTVKDTVYKLTQSLLNK